MQLNSGLWLRHSNASSGYWHHSIFIHALQLELEPWTKADPWHGTHAWTK